VPTTTIVQRLADVDAQIADIELRIIQQQKRVENLRAKGVDVTGMQSMVAVMSETLAYLEANKAELQRHLSCDR